MSDEKRPVTPLQSHVHAQLQSIAESMQDAIRSLPKAEDLIAPLQAIGMFALEEPSPGTFDRIRGAAAELNRLADHANEFIARVEGELASAGVGIEVWMPHPFDSTERTGTARGSGETVVLSEAKTLGFARVSGEWGLAVLCTETAGTVETGRKLLRDTDRQTRIRVVPAIPALLEEIERALIENTARLVEVLKSK